MTKPLNVADDIVPLNHFKTNASKLLRQMHASKRPLVITQNGKPAAVVLTPEEFDALNYRNRVVAAVERGLRDADAGRVVSSEDVRKQIKREFGE